MTESQKPLGMSDFFALEAGEYLERLDGLLAKGSSPSADEIVRLARALRGSALMASQPAIARTAAGLEAAARAGRDGARGAGAAGQSADARSAPARRARAPAVARPRRAHRPAAAPGPPGGHRARYRRAVGLRTRAPDQRGRAVPSRRERDRARRPRSRR